MSVHLICVVKESGVPLFARQSDTGIPPISFPVAAALNGAKIYGSEQGVELLSVVTGNSRVVWKDYRDTFALIVASRDDDLTDFHLTNFLDTVFNAMVLLVGLDNLLDTSNREKLKKEIRKVYPLIDLLMEGLGPLDEKNLHVGDLVQCPDRLCSTSDQATQQEFINNFSERAGCSYGSLSCNQVIIAATKKWWSLTPEENLLLIALGHLSKDYISEQLVYLPESSPRVPFRLAVIKTRTMRLNFLCGKGEKLSVLHKEARRMKNHPPAILDKVELDRATCEEARRYFTKCPNVVGFMAVNVQLGRCGAFILKDENTDMAKVVSRMDTLRTFYRNTVDSVFPWRIAKKIDGDLFEKPRENKVLESYWRSDYVHCHATRSAQLQVFALYEEDIGMANFRMSSRSLFCEVMHDKNF